MPPDSEIVSIRVLGDTGVGKDALLRRFTTGTFNLGAIYEFPADTSIRIIIEGHNVLAQMLIVQPRKSHSSWNATLLRIVHGFLLVY
nr:hypothetical protein [Candidatus Sigynarchaeota archaeon]